MNGKGGCYIEWYDYYACIIHGTKTICIRFDDYDALRVLNKELEIPYSFFYFLSTVTLADDDGWVYICHFGGIKILLCFCLFLLLFI